MSGFTRDEFELGLLIVEALEGEIAPAQFARLEQRIQSDPEASAAVSGTGDDPGSADVACGVSGMRRRC